MIDIAMVTTVGAKSKLGIFIVNHPLLDTIIILAFCEMFAFFFGEDAIFLLRLLKGGLAIFLPHVVLVYILSNKWCYKIEIDGTNSTINFYRICNRGIRTFSMKKIKVIIGTYCHIYINNADFILHEAYIHDLVSYLPKDTVVEYKGALGKSKEKYWNKINKPLIPGKLSERPINNPKDLK